MCCDEFFCELGGVLGASGVSWVEEEEEAQGRFWGCFPSSSLGLLMWVRRDVFLL